MEVIISILVFNSLASAGFSSFVASQKGRDAGAWFVLGFLFGIFALLAIAGLPSTNIYQNQIEDRIACTICREMISVNAAMCPFCQSQIEAPKQETEPGSSSSMTISKAETIEPKPTGKYRIGVSFNVFSVMPPELRYVIMADLHGHAADSGLKGGDRILKINEESTHPLEEHELTEKLGGRDLDEPVIVLISREGGFFNKRSEHEYVVKSDIKEYSST